MVCKTRNKGHRHHATRTRLSNGNVATPKDHVPTARPGSRRAIGAGGGRHGSSEGANSAVEAEQGEGHVITGGGGSGRHAHRREPEPMQGGGHTKGTTHLRHAAPTPRCRATPTIPATHRTSDLTQRAVRPMRAQAGQRHRSPKSLNGPHPPRLAAMVGRRGNRGSGRH